MMPTDLLVKRAKSKEKDDYLVLLSEAPWRWYPEYSNPTRFHLSYMLVRAESYITAGFMDSFLETQRKHKTHVRLSNSREADLLVRFGHGVAFFSSIQMALNAHKMLYLVGGPQVSLGLQYAIGGCHDTRGLLVEKDSDVVYDSDRKVRVYLKAMAGKEAMDGLGIALDVAAWDRAKRGIMRCLVGTLASQDDEYYLLLARL